MVYLAKELDKQNIKIPIWLVVQLPRGLTPLWKLPAIQTDSNSRKWCFRAVTVAGSLLNSDKKYMRPQFEEYDALETFWTVREIKILSIEQA
jgi:5-methyltetrahydrofolate--homocysteine methyltransferase